MAPTATARGDTRTLLPPEGNGREIEESLKPEDDLDKYDRKRLQKGLSYVNGAAKRKITPRMQQFLKLYQDACESALDGEVPEKASCAVVQALDMVYYSAAFYLKPRTFEEYENLMYYEIQANLKAAAISAGSELREVALNPRLLKTWLTIADELVSANMTDLQTHEYTTCGVLGIYPIHMLWLIEEWAKRNRIFHNHIRRHICRDLKELLDVAPNEDTATSYEKVLLSIQIECSLVISRDDPASWFPNDTTKKLLRKRGETRKAEEAGSENS